LAGEELWIVAGPSGTGGEGDHGVREVLARGTIRVNVPAAVWKVVLAMPPPVEPPNWSQSRLWAVWMPNDQSATQTWEIYQVPVRSVEARTGYRFFPKLPERVREQLSEVVASR
jgi:endonuclease G